MISDDPAKLRVVLGFIFGFLVLLIYMFLALAIAFKHIDKESVEVIFDAMGPLGGFFAGWAFGQTTGKNGSVRPPS